jgi:hypothetical protein
VCLPSCPHSALVGECDAPGIKVRCAGSLDEVPQHPGAERQSLVARQLDQQFMEARTGSTPASGVVDGPIGAGGKAIAETGQVLA